MSSNKKVSEQAYAYTPGLKVKRNMEVIKRRQLPIEGEALVKVGDEVDYDTIVAKTYVKGDPEIVKVAALLGFRTTPEDVEAYLLKNVGEKVTKGERFAGYKAFFGLFQKWVESPVDGIIESVSLTTGQVVIREAEIPVEISAYIPGKIVAVHADGATISTDAAIIQGIFGVGGEVHGEIKIAVENTDEVLSPDKITSDDKGKMLIGGSLMTLDAIKKAIEVGAVALITGGIRYHDVTTLLGEAIGVAITGHEEIGITLIATEGFGNMNMADRTFNLFKSMEGYLASGNGATQIRAGVIRPEIVIPHKLEAEDPSELELAAGMIPGTPIRLIREPYFGEIGVVHSLPVELQIVDTGSKVRVLDAKLDDGRIVTVPRANVEIIEE
jgi:hypothetical protein